MRGSCGGTGKKHVFRSTSQLFQDVKCKTQQGVPHILSKTVLCYSAYLADFDVNQTVRSHKEFSLVFLNIN
jgi:hypothetical protein